MRPQDLDPTAKTYGAANTQFGLRLTVGLHICAEQRMLCDSSASNKLINNQKYSTRSIISADSFSYMINCKVCASFDLTGTCELFSAFVPCLSTFNPTFTTMMHQHADKSSKHHLLSHPACLYCKHMMGS